MTVRAVGSGQAHLLDWLVNHAYQWQHGGKLLPTIDPQYPYYMRCLLMYYSRPVIDRMVADKLARLEARVAEEYDDKVERSVVLPRAPFGLDWEDVPDDHITRQYLREAGLPEVPSEADPMIEGTADRLEFGMKVRRRAHTEEQKQALLKLNEQARKRWKTVDRANREANAVCHDILDVSEQTPSIPHWTREDLKTRARRTDG